MRLPAWRRTDVVQYVPERSLTVRALDDRGATLAYGKAYGPGAARASVTARRHRQVARELRRSADRVSAPDSLAWSNERGLLLMEAMPGPALEHAGGRPTSAEPWATWASPSRSCTAAPRPRACRRSARLRPDRIAHCAQILARARPDVAAPAERLAARLGAATPEPAADVVLHGDCHPGNALVDGDAVALVDLDQMGLGPAAADLGSLVARLRYAATVGDLGAAEATELEARFLAGYAERRPLPDASSLAWHTAAALVAERALRAVNRVNRAGLARLARAHGRRRRGPRRGSAPVSRPHLLFYCQHSLGLGHLARSLAIADALAGTFDVTLLNGGRLPAGTRIPAGVRVVSLPPLGHDDDYQLVSLDPAWNVSAAQQERRRMILGVLERHVAPGAPRRAVPVRSQEVRVRAGAPPGDGSRRVVRAGRSCCAACGTSWCAVVATRPGTTSGRASGPTRSSTRCSCTPTRRSRAWRTRSPRGPRCGCPSTTPASSPRDRSRTSTNATGCPGSWSPPEAAWWGSHSSARRCACTPSSPIGPG